MARLRTHLAHWREARLANSLDLPATAVQKKAAGTHLPGQSQLAAHVGTVCNAPEHTHAYGDAEPKGTQGHSLRISYCKSALRKNHALDRLRGLVTTEAKPCARIEQPANARAGTR